MDPRFKILSSGIQWIVDEKRRVIGYMDDDKKEYLIGSTEDADKIDAAQVVPPPVSGGGSGVRAKRWGQVATRTVVPSAINAGIFQTMSRTVHIARDAITSLKLLYPNWYVPAGSGETGSGGVMTITASIEYPAGTFTQVMFSSATSGTAASGANLLSDETAVVIPFGATFYVRTLQANATATINQGPSTPVRPGDGFRASGSTDQTMGGTVNTATGTIYGPSAILANTAVGSAFLLGDSLVYGSQDNGDATTDTGYFSRAIGHAKPYINCGVSGDTAAGFLLGNTQRLALAQYCTVVFCDYGTNDVFGARTADQLIADLITIRNLFALQFYQATLLPRVLSTGSDSFVTVATQTIQTANSHRNRANNMIRASGIPLLSGFVDVAAVVESPITPAGAWSGQSGVWREMGVVRATTGDGNITSGTNSYSSASAAFTTADSGSLIQIAGAGTAGASLLGVMTYVNGTTVTLTDAVSGAVRNAGTTVTTANAQIGVLPLTIDGTHPYKWGYQLIASAHRGLASIVV